MSNDEDALDWDLVERLFTEARKLDPDERRAYIEAHAEGKAAVAKQVHVLLANDHDDGFLEPPGDVTLLQHLEGAQAPAPDLEGHMLFGQYELGALIGRGASGAVYEGTDRFTKRAVAVKVLTDSAAAASARYELSSLRLLRLPGVVELLDDGTDLGLGTCLVMEKIEGRPFGPYMGPMPWADVRRTTSVLLEILARIHARGMLHKDLKPGNVLVDEDGIPTVLDLGISGVPQVPPAGHPEPSGKVVRISGIPDRRQRNKRALLIGTPAYMAPELARGMLPTEASDIYAVGLLALEALTGARRHDSGHTPTILVEKQSYDGETLEAWLSDSLVPEEAEDLLRELLAPNPWERPRTARRARELFEPERSGVRHPAVEAETEEGLRAVFVGHERLFHIPSDAAHELARRTNGEPRDIEAELDAWETARLGHWEDDGFHISREAIETLRAGFHPRVPAEAPEIPDGTQELLPYIRVLPAPATKKVLAEASNLSREEVDAALDKLEAAGIVEAAEGGTYTPSVKAFALRLPDHAADYAGRLANAWPPGPPGRLELLIQAGRDAEVPAAAIYAARSAFERGSLLDCVRVCELGLRTKPPVETEFALLAVLLRASIPQTSTAAIDRALMLVERSNLPESRRRPLEQIARCALFTLAGRTDRAWEALPERDTHEDEVLRVLDDMVRTFLLRQLPLDEQEERARALFGPPETAEGPAAISAWAWLHLFQNRFEEAAQLFERQVELASNESSRISLLTNVLYTRMLLCKMDEAEAIAHELKQAATERRMARVLANVEFDLRHIEYARGGLPAHDPELIEAVRALGHGQFTERWLLQESAFAWRSDQLEIAKALLAELMATPLEERGGIDPVARALCAHLDQDACKETKETLTASIENCETPSDVVQVIALMALRDPAWIEDLHATFDEALAKIPKHTWHLRREVLSIDACVKYVKPESQA